MSRPIRLDVPDALVHVTGRGPARGMFRDDIDRESFLALLEKCVRRADWTLLGYVLLRRDFQLVIRLRKATLSRGLQWLNGEYGKLFNRRRNRVGHLFEGRVSCLLVDPCCLLDVLRSVVMAPVKEGLVELPEDYEWSSHRALSGAIAPPGWLDTSGVWSHFDDDNARAATDYRRFIDHALREKVEELEAVPELCVGRGEEWLANVRSQVRSRPRGAEHPRRQRNVGGPAMADVIASVASTFSLTGNEVPQRRVPRLFAVWLASFEANLTNGEIAASLGLRNHSHISQLAKQADRLIGADARLQHWLDRCLSTLRRNDHRSQT